MGDLVPRYYDPTPVSRQTRKQLAQIEEKGLVRRQGLEAAGRDTQHEAEMREALDYFHAKTRLHGVYELGHDAQDLSAGLDDTFAPLCAFTAKQIIYRYGTGGR